MLYHLFDYLEEIFQLPGSGLWKFLSFRAGVAIILSLVISMLFGKRIIRSLTNRQIGESVRDLGLAGEKQKQGTPTMGGLIIILAILVPCLLLADLTNVYVLLMLFATVWLGCIGFTDDYIKVFKKDKSGLKGRFKVLGQVVLGLVVAMVMLNSDQITVRMSLQEAQRYGYEIIQIIPGMEINEPLAYVKSTLTNLPFFKGNLFEYTSLLGFLGDNAETFVYLVFIPIIVFIVTSVSNGANLTDGLDGLATGVSAIVAATLVILAYVSSNTLIADYLNILYLPILLNW